MPRPSSSPPLDHDAITIAPSKWPVVLPYKLDTRRSRRGLRVYPNDTYQGMTYHQAEQLMGQMECDCIAQNTVNERLYSVWKHPCGVLFTMMGYGHSEGQPARHGMPTLSAIHVHIEFNSGTRPGNRIAASRLGGIGGSHIRHNGTTSWSRRFRCAGPGDRGLLWLLDAIQSVATIVPFDQWIPPIKVHLADEYWLQAEPSPVHLEKQQQRFLARCPAALRPHLVLGPGHDAKTTAVSRHKNDAWRRLEPALELFGETLDSAGIAWPNPRQSQCLMEWASIADSPECVRPNLTATGVLGPGGTSLAVTMLASSARADNIQRLFDQLDALPESALQQLATQPDATGHTLLSHALRLLGDPRCISSDGSTLFHRAIPVGAATGCLHRVVRRLGAQGIFFPNAGGAMGILAQQMAASDPAARNADVLLERQLAFLDEAVSLGIPTGAGQTVFDPECWERMRQKYPRTSVFDRLEALEAHAHLDRATSAAVDPPSKSPRL